jgi:hypothetical protein
MWMPLWLSCLARVNSQIGQFDTAERCIGEAGRSRDCQGKMVRS